MPRVSPLSGVPGTTADGESFGGSTEFTPSSHNMWILGGVFEELLSLEDFLHTICWARTHLREQLED